MNNPAKIGMTRSSTPRARRNLRFRHDQGTDGGGGAIGPWGALQPSPPGLSPIDPLLSSISPTAPEVRCGPYRSGRCRRHENRSDHIALDGLVGWMAGEKRQGG